MSSSSTKGLQKQITSERLRMRRQAGSADEGHDWLTTYGDLMTLLLVFFVLFYIFSITGQLPLLSEALEQFQHESMGTTDDIMQATGDDFSEGEMVFSIPSQVLFDLGKADLKQAAIPYLDEAMDSIKTILMKYPNAEIRIEGYTDNLPIHNWRFRNNWELSAVRAITVVQYMIEKHQFQPEKLQAMGYGEYDPVVPNDTPEHRRMNRRVELKVVKTTNGSGKSSITADIGNENAVNNGSSQ